MRRHEISSAGADESGRPRSVADADASGPHAPEHAVTFDGMKSNRNTATASVAAAGTAHNNRDAGTPFPKNLSKNPHRAGPRARRPLPPSWLAQQLRPPDATAAVPGNAGSARTAAAAPATLTDSAAPHANAATAGPHPDRTGCNTDSADGTAGMASHIPSAGRYANTCLGGAVCDVGPRPGAPGRGQADSGASARVAEMPRRPSPIKPQPLAEDQGGKMSVSAAKGCGCRPALR
jgi:hypothetical protein